MKGRKKRTWWTRMSQELYLVALILAAVVIAVSCLVGLVSMLVGALLCDVVKWWHDEVKKTLLAIQGRDGDDEA